MLGFSSIRKDRAAIEAQLKTKDPEINLSAICELDHSIREGKTKVEALKAKRNEVSQKIGEMKRLGQDPSELMAEVAKSAEEIHHLDHQTKELEEKFNDEMSRLPNIPMEDIQVARSER